MAVATASAMTLTQEIKLSAQLDDWRLDGAVPRPTDLPDVLSVEAANGPNGVLISRSIIQVLPRGGVGQLSVELTASAPLKAVFGWVRIEYPHLRSAVFIAQSVALEGSKASMSAPLYLPLDATGVSMWMKVIGLPDKDRLSIAAKLVPVESALPNAEVDQVIDVIRRRAIRSKDVNWESVSAMARTIEARRVGGSGVSDAALKFIVTSLGDGHSFLIADEPPVAKPSTASASSSGVAPSALPPSVPTLAPPVVPHRATFGAVQFLKPALSRSREPIQAQAYADALVESLRSRPDGACGWIVDLRGNDGGNLWPMVAGLKPLLGGGTQGWFLDSGGGRSWGFSPGYVGSGTLEVRTARSDGIDLSAQPVAVLQDGRSASSAEALLMAFKRRPETRLFGAPSAGLTTANAVVDVAGKSVALSTSMMADSYKVTYPKGIEPDEAMRETELRAAPDAESLRAPIAWLESRCKRSEETLSVK